MPSLRLLRPWRPVLRPCRSLGGVLLLVAIAVEGRPPALDGGALLAFGYVSLVATALAYVVWFAALQRLETGALGLVGLLNPVTGVLLGVLVAHEGLGARQAVGIVLVLTGLVLGQRLRPASSRSASRDLCPSAGRAAPASMARAGRLRRA